MDGDAYIRLSGGEYIYYYTTLYCRGIGGTQLKERITMGLANSSNKA
jgi:hypothetical protein